MKRKSHAGMELVRNRVDLRDLLDTPPWDWPPDTARRFLDVLNDRQASASDRLIAAQHAGDLVVVNDELCAALMGIVSAADELEQLRTAAVVSLGPALEQGYTFEFGEDPDDVPISEHTFHGIQAALRKLFPTESVPKMLRRRILEVSVRSPEDWHREAIRQAYSSGDRDWVLTSVFAMQYVRGFDDWILEALRSSDPDIHYEAVCAAGNRELGAAWDHIFALVDDSDTPRPIRLAAIEAIGSIRPQEARGVLIDLTESDDEEIVEAAEEALALVEPEDLEDDEEEDDDTGDWIH
jgi:hypothetical protein